MSDTCKWIKYKDSYLWHTECGRSQGTKIRPKQKKCYCGKPIERIELDELSLSDKEFIKMLRMHY